MNDELLRQLQSAQQNLEPKVKAIASSSVTPSQRGIGFDCIGRVLGVPCAILEPRESRRVPDLCRPPRVVSRITVTYMLL